MHNYCFVAQKKNERLDEFLRGKIAEILEKSGALNAKILRLIVSGNVSVEKKQCRRPAYELRRGEKVKFSLDETKFFAEKTVDDIAFELTEKDVLFEDEALIVVNKPAFFPTEATFQQSRDNLHAAVVRYLWAKMPLRTNCLKSTLQKRYIAHSLSFPHPVSRKQIEVCAPLPKGNARSVKNRC